MRNKLSFGPLWSSLFLVAVAVSFTPSAIGQASVAKTDKTDHTVLPLRK
jgi:hypothetical protein